MQSEQRSQSSSNEPHEEPLPLTFRFVVGFGMAIFIGWFMMYFLLRARM